MFRSISTLADPNPNPNLNPNSKPNLSPNPKPLILKNGKMLKKHTYTPKKKQIKKNKTVVTIIFDGKL